MGCCHGYLSTARCRLAYGPADATATHCLLFSKIQIVFFPFWYRPTRVVPDKGPFKQVCVCVCALYSIHLITRCVLYGNINFVFSTVTALMCRKETAHSLTHSLHCQCISEQHDCHYSCASFTDGKTGLHKILSKSTPRLVYKRKPAICGIEKPSAMYLGNIAQRLNGTDK